MMLWMWACVAAAGPPLGPVVIVPAESDSVAFVDNIYGALERDGVAVTPQAFRTGIDRPPAESPVGDRERAKKLLQDARTRFRDLDLEAAQQSVQAAIAELVSLPRPEDQSELLVDALIFSAIVIGALGDDANLASSRTADIDRALRLAARLEPSRAVLDAGLYPPSIVEAFASIQLSLRAERDEDPDDEAVPVMLNLQVLTAGNTGVVECLLDGNIIATGSQRVASGPHLLSCRSLASRQNGAALSAMVTWSPPSAAHVFALAPRDAAAQRTEWVAGARRGDDRAINALREHLGADVVVVLSDPRRVFLADRDAELEVTSDNPERIALALSELIRVEPSAVPFEAVVLGVAGAAVAVGALAAANVVYFVVPLSPTPKAPPRPVIISCCTN
jgi:hypothetical protein